MLVVTFFDAVGPILRGGVSKAILTSTHKTQQPLGSLHTIDTALKHHVKLRRISCNNTAGCAVHKVLNHSVSFGLDWMHIDLILI